MGVSFKVSRAGTRYRPKLFHGEEKDNESGSATEPPQRVNEGGLSGIRDKVADVSILLAKPVMHSVLEDAEVSFSINLFPNGFSVGKPTELCNDVPKQLHPYDSSSKSLFSAIEYGWLPGDIFGDIPRKYVNGALLCEIQDYRDCTRQEGGSAACMESSPIVYRVLLQTCMENVVKDILSISDDSWTYEDMLEVESRILKALQPDLHLDPDPLLDRFCGKPQTKKLNLGISSNLKKRKLSDAPAPSIEFNNPCHVPRIPGIGVTLNSESQFGLAFLQQTISNSIANPQENKETMSQSRPLALEPNDQLADSCCQSVSTTLITSNIVPLPKQCLTESSSSVLGERGRSETQEIQVPILKKPKQEPMDFSRNYLLNERVDAERISRENSSQSINNSRQPTLEGTPKLQAGMPTLTVKLEPAETSDFPCSSVRNIKDKHLVMDLKSKQFNLRRLQLQKASPLLRASISQTPWNHMIQPVDKNLSREIVRQNKKALPTPQATIGGRSTSVSTSHRDLLQREKSVSAKSKTKFLPKGLTMKVVNSLVSSRNAYAASSNSSAMGNLSLPQPSEIKDDQVIERLLKIERVTQRYGLHKRKCKLNQFLHRKPNFNTSPLAVFNLLSSEDNGNPKDAITDRISLSKCSFDRRLHVFKTRTLMFVHQCHVNQEKTSKLDVEAEIKLVLREKLDEGKVETMVFYGHEEEFDSIDFPFLPTFPSSHFADLFAAQFALLVVHEGYHLASDRVELIPHTTDSESSNLKSSVSSSATPVAGRVELPSQTLFQGLSPFMLPPTRDGMAALNHSQFPLPNILSGEHLLSPGNIQSALQLSTSNLSKSQLELAAKLYPMQAQWQQIINKRAQFQLQMLQRHRQQQQLQHMQSMVGELGAVGGGLGTMQLGGGIQGLGNISVGPFGNVMGMGGSIGNVEQFNNVASNISSLNQSNQLLGAFSDQPAAVLARLRTVQGQGIRAMASGLSIQRSAGMVPMHSPNVPNFSFNSSNQQPSPLLINRELHMLPQLQQQQLAMKSLLQPQEAASLAEHLGSPASGSALQQMNTGMMMVGPESPELSVQTHGVCE